MKVNLPNVLPDLKSAEHVYAHLAQTILDAIGQIPETEERKSRTPGQQARQIASTGRTRAALAAGTMAMPPGLAGMLTLVPELLTVWRIQTQMVADIAAVYGQSAKLTPEQMLYCLFKATAAKTVGALVVMVGESVLVRRPTLRALQNIAVKIGMKISQRLLAKGIARWLPFIGAASVGAFTYYETGQVAQTAIALFEKPIDVESKRLPAKSARSAKPVKPAKSAKTAKRIAPGAKPLADKKTRTKAAPLRRKRPAK